MAEIGAIVNAIALNSLISVRPMPAGVPDTAQQAANQLKAQVGQLVQGTIFGMDAQGEPLMKSDQGNLALKLPFHLPSGAEIVLRIEAANGGSRARILSIDGLPLKAYVAQLAGGSQGGAGTEDIVSVPSALAQSAAQEAVKSESAVVGRPTTAPLPGEIGAVQGQSSLGNPAPSSSGVLGAGSPEGDSVFALLLSRNPQLPELLAKLPAGFAIPARLQPGTGIRMQLVGVEKTATSAATLGSTGSSTSPASGILPNAPAPTPLALNQMLGLLAAQQQARNSLPPANDAALPAPPAAAAQTPTIGVPAQAAQTLQNVVAAMTTARLIETTPASPTTVAGGGGATTPTNLPAVASSGGAAGAQAEIPSASPPAPPVPTSSTEGLPTGPGGNFGGQVIDVDAAGDALIQTMFGVVRLPNGANPLQEGDRVQWRLQGFSLPPTSDPVIERSSNMLGLASRWGSLGDALDLLAASQATSGNLPGQNLLAHIPQPDGKMGAALAFFIAALRRNEPESWIGRNTITHLTGMKRLDLLQSLESDFALLRQPLVDSPSTQWQGLFFPIYADQQLQQARLFIHRNPDEEHGDGKDQAGRKPDVRFVLELELSALGDMQLCGLVKKSTPTATGASAATHFDLVVRSLKNVPAEHQQGMRRIFTEGAALTGYQGQILFQRVQEFPETPMESFAAAIPGWTA